jgi:uncharacterized membrane protein required for colicin V production
MINREERMNMHVLDGVILLLLVGGLLRGYRRGLILQAASLAGLVLAWVVAFYFTDEVTPVLQKNVPLPESVTGDGLMRLLPLDRALYSVMAFLILFFGTKLVISILSRVLNQLAQLPVLSVLNRIGGLILGVLQAVLLVWIMVNLLNFLPWEKGREAVQQSGIAQNLLEVTPQWTAELKQLLHDAMRQRS